MGRNVSADVDALIDFRSHLISFNRTLSDEVSSMRSHWQNLGDAWNDIKYDQFGAALDEAVRSIDRYLSVTEDHEAHLLALISRLRDFLDT